MNTSQIIGTGSYLPGKPITVDTLKEVVGVIAEDIVNKLGAKTRYWAVDPKTGIANEDNSDMGTKAALNAIKNAEVDLEEIDLIISVTCTPDYPLPANGPLIQEKLGIHSCAVIEIRAGCNGVAQALTIADQFLKTGSYHTALIIGSELTSTYTISPFFQNDKNIRKGDLLNAVMFGDGAGAAILKANPKQNVPGIISTHLDSIGVGKPMGFYLPSGGSKNPISSKTIEEGNYHWIQDYKSIAKYDAEMAFCAIDSILKKSDINSKDLKMIILPQANASRIKDAISTTANPLTDYADRFFLNVEDIGNTSAAGVLIALDEVNRKKLINYNELMIIVGAESSKWLCGAIMLRWAIKNESMTYDK